MELWFAQQLLDTVLNLLEDNEEFRCKEATISGQIADLFDKKPAARLTTVSDILSAYQELQRKIDVAINNCPITHTIILPLFWTNR
jgi:hypothetical protein